MSASNGNVNGSEQATPDEQPQPVVQHVRKRTIHPPCQYDVEAVPTESCPLCEGSGKHRDGDRRVPCPACGATGAINGGKLLVCRAVAPYERDDFFLDDDQAADVIQKLGGTVAEDRSTLVTATPGEAATLAREHDSV